MSRLTRHRPSPSMVVALIALFVSMGGVSWAIAAGSIGSREIKNNSVRSKDIKNNDVRGKDIRTGTVRGSDVGNDSLTGADILESSLGTVPSATNASNATHATNATTASNADKLDGKDSSAFGPKAYAHVNADGTVDTANSKNIASANITHSPGGNYCINGLSFTPHNVVATLGFGAPLNSDIYAAIAPSASCQVGVAIYSSGGSEIDVNHYILLN